VNQREYFEKYGHHEESAQQRTSPREIKEIQNIQKLTTSVNLILVEHS